MTLKPTIPIEERLDRWAAARERRNGPGGHGQTGTKLLRDAAQEIRDLKLEMDSRDNQ